MSDPSRPVLRAIACFDLLVTAPLATPPTARAFLDLLFAANGALGGQELPPAFDGLAWLFVNLSGVLGVLWALARIADPRPLLGALDAGARVGVAGLIVLQVVAGGAPGILYLFVATELAGAALALRVLLPRTRAGADAPARAS